MRSTLVVTALICVSPAAAHAAGRVAVQPFGGAELEPYRQQVAKILGRHGCKVVTSLPRVSGTSQYPGLAKERSISAFVVADADDKGDRILLSFLVWQGLDGSVIGRWEVAASKKQMAERIAREFWPRLGRAIGKARAPRVDELRPAPTMYINAGPNGPNGPSSRMTPPRRKVTRPAAPSKGKRPLSVTI
jgi:hypothetical protein